MGQQQFYSLQSLIQIEMISTQQWRSRLHMSTHIT